MPTTNNAYSSPIETTSIKTEISPKENLLISLSPSTFKKNEKASFFVTIINNENKEITLNKLDILSQDVRIEMSSKYPYVSKNTLINIPFTLICNRPGSYEDLQVVMDVTIGEKSSIELLKLPHFTVLDWYESKWLPFVVSLFSLFIPYIAFLLGRNGERVRLYEKGIMDLKTFLATEIRQHLNILEHSANERLSDKAWSEVQTKEFFLILPGRDRMKIRDYFQVYYSDVSSFNRHHSDNKDKRDIMKERAFISLKFLEEIQIVQWFGILPKIKYI